MIDTQKVLAGLLCALLLGLGGWLVGTVRTLEADQRATLTAVKLFHGQVQAGDLLPAMYVKDRHTSSADCCFAKDLHRKAAHQAIYLIDSGRADQAKQVLEDALRATR